MKYLTYSWLFAYVLWSVDSSDSAEIAIFLDFWDVWVLELFFVLSWVIIIIMISHRNLSISFFSWSITSSLNAISRRSSSLLISFSNIGLWIWLVYYVISVYWEALLVNRKKRILDVIVQTETKKDIYYERTFGKQDKERKTTTGLREPTKPSICDSTLEDNWRSESFFIPNPNPTPSLLQVATSVACAWLQIQINFFSYLRTKRKVGDSRGNKSNVAVNDYSISRNTNA